MRVTAQVLTCRGSHRCEPRAEAMGRPGSSAVAGERLTSRSPIDGHSLGEVPVATRADYDRSVDRAVQAFAAWRTVPAPRRGELLRRFGMAVRRDKARLAELITLEVGKIRAEAEGEVQEVIDVCDFAVGLSRQLHGLTIASERPQHHMLERWHPLGPVGVITAFNFPMAVWAWNAALALVCGDSVIWKPSEKTPLTAAALAGLLEAEVANFPEAPAGLATVLQGGREPGQWLAADPRLPLISATGSTRMGREVATTVAARFGRSLLELGGNNAMIVAPSASEDLAVRAIVFAAVGTAGQRCTTLRRLYVHESRRAALLQRLSGIYAGLRIGDPREADVLVGPLINAAAFEAMQAALAAARAAGGRISGGERVEVPGASGGWYARPAIVELDAPIEVSRQETFAPILYVLGYREFAEAVRGNNEVSQGLSSSLFTRDLAEAEHFLSVEGSDCGIANVNIGTSGAEIGGAFGGEKETGGGRESGSDAWRAYMRRQTQTINYSSALPLAQGVSFDIGG
ncbi:MAG: aldehyde dehydrogenase family protein [Sinobacteraceae bacterium]|nr:aldehyde dehydrogenase family protein [Nevskiaceae bacterium]MCP5359438.1 aldehyde dehydrogenase family protein [Nevskiaceae bacterium]MCP5467299.1 aldehyde dehydrogenase family protein [Nevskiaceae bacterium]